MTAPADTALTVLRGRPDDVELAAVTAVLRAMAQRADAAAPQTAPGPAHARWAGGDGRTRPAGSWRSGGGHRPGPAGRARGTA
ncbi:acyl-CoA carboxylase epsilon subunit [Streptomyces sp. NPDC058471]|uniref:acyl-CoA carboxylase epsilon subunit n=1 Tax=Streptomyces sp. NPDC058471 TaxID=3346516 RepID=UPI0036495EFD